MPCGVKKSPSASAALGVLECMYMVLELTMRRSQVLVKRVLAMPQAYLIDHIETDFLPSGKNSNSTIIKSRRFLMVIGRQLEIAPLTTSQGLVNATAAR